MKSSAAIAAAILAVASTQVSAQSVGGELGIEYKAPFGGDDFGGLVYSGGLEYNFMQPVSLSLNATGFNPDFLSESGSNITAHATYHLDVVTSVGLFYARDSFDDVDVSSVGVEAGTELMGGIVEGYVGRAEESGDSGFMLGASSEYGLGRGFSALAELDALFIDDNDTTDVAIGAEYEIQNGPNFYAKLGRFSGEGDTGSVNETYIAIGVDISFGPDRGTTFSNRSLLDVLPSF